MNKFFAIVLFPIFWITMYLYRIVWFDCLSTLIEIVLNLFINPLSSIWLLVTLPIVLIIDIPVGMVVTFIGAIGMSADIFNNEIDVALAIKTCFSKKTK